MRNVKLYIVGFFALAIITLMLIIAPSVARKIDGTDEAHRTAVIQQTALDLERERLQLQQEKATAPATVAFSYILVAGIAASVTIGGAVAWQRLYKKPLIKADVHGRLPVARELLTNMERQNEAMLIIAQAMHQATQVQLAQANATARLADEVKITLTSQPRAAIPAQAAPQLPQPAPEPAFDMISGKYELLPRIETTNANRLLLGIDQHGTEHVGNLHTLMHTGLLGQTNGGKTTTLAAYALQIAHDPRCLIAIADPHMQELALLEDSGAFWKSTPSNMVQAVAMLSDVHKEIQRRALIIGKVSEYIYKRTDRRPVLNNIDRYNAAAQRIKGAPVMPPLVLFADEIKALASHSPDTDTAMQAITSEGRKFGIYLVAASQSWKSDVVSTDVRAQFCTRIALYGSQFRQVAELFEVTQPEAKTITSQLVASGNAAVWQRQTGTTILKTPYIDIESDEVYYTLKRIEAARRSTSEASCFDTASGSASGSASESASESAFMALGQSKTLLLTDNAERLDLGEKPQIEVTDEERSAIIEASKTIPSRRKVCQAIFNTEGGDAYKKVKIVLDSLGATA